jgi:hypothetical protein
MAKRSTKTVRRAPLARGSRRSPAFDRRTRQGEDEPTVTATIVAREPDAAYPQGLAALGDALVLQMFDSGLGETLRMAYTMLQKHQERQNRRAARSAPEIYDYLLWILERRAESKGHHAIARLLNTGIDLGQGLVVPPTPSLLAYQRKPYLERQDPETGDVLHLPRPLPATTWNKQTVEGICRQAVDGIYAGVLNWGRRYNRFLEDAEGNAKTPVSVDTGRPLVPLDLIERVQVVERAPGNGSQRMSDFNSFLLSLRCGYCGEAMHGYTSTKTKPSGRKYKYRKYRCAGRVNNPGACDMPILSADGLEQLVINAIFSDIAQRDGERLQSLKTARS